MYKVTSCNQRVYEVQHGKTHNWIAQAAYVNSQGPDLTAQMRSLSQCLCSSLCSLQARALIRDWWRSWTCILLWTSAFENVTLGFLDKLWIFPCDGAFVLFCYWIIIKTRNNRNLIWDGQTEPFMHTRALLVFAWEYFLSVYARVGCKCDNSKQTISHVHARIWYIRTAAEGDREWW